MIHPPTAIRITADAITIIIQVSIGFLLCLLLIGKKCRQLAKRDGSERERDGDNFDGFASAFQDPDGLSGSLVTANELRILPKTIFNVFPGEQRIIPGRNSL